MQQHPQHGKPQESARKRREVRTLEPVPPFGTGSKGANFMCAYFALVATQPGSHDMHVIYMELQDVTRCYNRYNSRLGSFVMEPVREW